MIRGLMVEISRNIAAPMGRRIGTALAAYLLAQGIPQDMADKLLLAIGVAGGVALDCIAYYVFKGRKG